MCWVHTFGNFCVFYFDLDLSPVEITPCKCLILEMVFFFFVRYTYIVIVTPNGTRQIVVHSLSSH